MERRVSAHSALIEEMRVGVNIEPPLANLRSGRASASTRFGQARRQGVANSGSAGRRVLDFGRAGRVPRWASGVASRVVGQRIAAGQWLALAAGEDLGRAPRVALSSSLLSNGRSGTKNDVLKVTMQLAVRSLSGLILR